MTDDRPGRFIIGLQICNPLRSQNLRVLFDLFQIRLPLLLLDIFFQAFVPQILFLFRRLFFKFGCFIDRCHNTIHEHVSVHTFPQKIQSSR